MKNMGMFVCVLFVCCFVSSCTGGKVSQAVTLASTSSVTNTATPVGEYTLQPTTTTINTRPIPTGLTATSVSSTQIDLKWTAQSTNMNVTGYTIMYASNNLFKYAQTKSVAGKTVGATSIIGLTGATTYFIKIKSEGKTDSYDSLYSAVVNETNSPAGLTASAISSNQIDLSWTANANNTSIKGYTIAISTSSTFSGASYQFAGGDNTTHTYSASQLLPATIYYFKIKAEGTEDAFDSTLSSVASVATKMLPPAAPILQAVANSTSQVTLSWNNVSGEDGYKLERKITGTPTFTVVGTLASNIITFINTGLTANTSYDYRINSYNSGGSSASPTVTVMTKSSVPAVPILQATVNSSNDITLSWADVANETGYKLESRATGTTTFAQIGSLTANMTSYVHSALLPSTSHDYRISAFNGSGSSALSAIVTATTLAAAATAPTGLAAVSASSSQINLTWTPQPTNPNIKGYTIAHSTSSSMTNSIYVSSGSTNAASAFSLGGLLPSTTYYFKIKAEGTTDLLDSPLSGSVSATTASVATPTPPPVILTGTKISPSLFGQNAWMPQIIGARVHNGKLADKWPEIKASGAKLMRHGGIGVDENYCGPEMCYHTKSGVTTTAVYNNDPVSLTNNSLNQYVKLIQDMRTNGMEPVLEVPYFKGRATATIAANIVRYINITKGLHVKYWTIGNEPDLGYWPHAATASLVAAYLKPYAKAMKFVDPTIKIIGPDTAWFDTSVINGLTQCPGISGVTTPGPDDITGKDSNGNYYIDVLAFHTYPSSPTSGRQEVIDLLTKSGGFQANLTTLQSRLTACNTHKGRSGPNAITMGVTEANVDFQSPTVATGFDGQGSGSFLGGQFWAELLGIAMKKGVEMVTFWGVIEGDNVGFFNSAGLKYSTYHHFQMMATNFKGNSIDGTNKVNGVASGKVKIFASKDATQIAVLIMNQELTADYNFTLRFDNGTVSGANPLKLNVDASISKEHIGFIKNESSLLLVFDHNGFLKKKITYERTSSDAAANALPVTVIY